MVQVIYGTGIHEASDLRYRGRDGLALTLLHPKSWRAAGLHLPTIFLISRFEDLPFTDEWFIAVKRTPRVGPLSRPDWRAFLDILFVDGFVCEDNPAEHWNAYDGPLYGSIQRFRRASGAPVLNHAVVLATPWRQNGRTFVEVAPLTGSICAQPDWVLKPLCINDYEDWQGSRVRVARFNGSHTVDFSKALTVPLSTEFFPDAPNWSRKRMTLPDRSMARSLWAGWQHDRPSQAGESTRLPPDGWTLPTLLNWP